MNFPESTHGQMGSSVTASARYRIGDCGGLPGLGYVDDVAPSFSGWLVKMFCIVPSAPRIAVAS